MSVAWNLGKVPIVVPRRPTLGEHVDGHQLRFVARMQEEGRCIVPESYDEFLKMTGDSKPYEHARQLNKAVAALAEVVCDVMAASYPSESSWVEPQARRE